MDLLCLKGCDISICRSNGLKFCLLLLIIIWQIILRFRTWGYVLRLSRKRKMIWTEKSKIWKRNVRLWFYSHVMSLFLPKTSLFIVIFWAFWSYTCYLKTSGKLFFFFVYPAVLICKAKLVDQQQEMTSNWHVETLKQKIMKLRKENEVLKRKFSHSQESK